MDYENAICIINSTNDMSVDTNTKTIETSIGFVYETYTDDIKQAISLLKEEYGYSIL